MASNRFPVGDNGPMQHTTLESHHLLSMHIPTFRLSLLDGGNGFLLEVRSENGRCIKQAQYTKAGETLNGKETSSAVSNVARIGRATLLEDEENGFEQVVYYQAGIGADAELGLFQKGSENINGTKLLSNIRTAYGFICENYDYGDEIYITGFSRGAYIARSVAGLVAKIGILTKKGQELFYEAFDYYMNSNYYKTKQLQNPVSEATGTTRIHYPNTNPPQPIKIRAVGVWDTVGGLGEDKLSWHDTSLGSIVEHGYHMLSLNERRGFFAPTLWESPNIPRSLETLEQCWTAGDHSNVGGSWVEQQLSDITLAWMMSRFDALGVKFDQNYLYHEYEKLNDWVKTKGPAAGYPANMSPRQWGEGRSGEIYTFKNVGWGGRVQRTPGEYPGLKNTNETMHPVVRYRHFCKNKDHLGADDGSAFNPSSLNGWTWPSAQKDGKIGEGQPTTVSGPLKYTKGGLQIPESPMGKYEKQLLAIYNEDPGLQARDGSIWEKVLGGKTGPGQHVKDGIALMKKPLINPYSGSTTQPSSKLYIGKQPAVSWDEPYLKDYAHLGNIYRVGSWNGNETCAQGGPAPFSSLCTITPNSKIVSVRSFYDPDMQALAGFSVYHQDNIYEWYTWGQEGYEESTMTLAEGEKIVKMETKAFKPAQKDLLICGMKLTTDKGQTWSSCGGYDQLSNDMVVSEDAPGPECSLKGFYGGLGDFVDRLGPVWGK
ncbi:MAG: hypothetical protein Q9220_007395 [cf. Caloplaca sp. 1 TL-2023]